MGWAMNGEFTKLVLCLLTARKAKLIEVPILKTESPI